MINTSDAPSEHVTRLPLVYVASPYTLGDPVINTNASIHFGNLLMELGFAVQLPLLSMFWHAVTPKTYDEWLMLDEQWVLRADALFRLPGQSSGADHEVRVALANGIPVFTSVDDLVDWRILTWPS